MTRVITLGQVGETVIRDLAGRTLVRIIVDEIGPAWQAVITTPPYEEKDDEGFHRSEHHFHIEDPY